MSEVTVPNEASEVEYAITTSSAGPFIVPFSFFEQQDIKVVKRDDVTNVETELVITTDWTFNLLDVPADQLGVGYEGGEITLNVALENHTLKIYRDTVIERLTNYPSTGPFAIYLLNNELSRMIAIMQELEAQAEKYISLPDSALDSTPWNGSGRAMCNIAESAADNCAATNRQVDANGPNWLADNDSEYAVGDELQWNTIFSAANIVIEGNDTTKFFDLMTQFFALIQNRNASEALFYIRYRYQVDCYSEVTKIANPVYPIRIAGTSAIPFNFMDIAEDIDYTNGNCTVSVGIDIYPQDANSGDLFIQWGNLSVNTSEPR
jgi:hypothetical protein